MELLSYSFVRSGLMAAVIIGATCSLIGVFVVLRGMSYVGAGIAHGCLAGVALALLMGWNPMLLSVIATLFMVIFIEILGKKASLKMDTSIGVIFSLTMAFAVLFIGMMRRYTQDIMSYLFGSLLQVTVVELWAGLAVGALVTLVITLFFKEIQFSTFDPEMAEVSGIPAAVISLMLTLLMGLTIVVSLKAVGELMVLALIVLPASTAYQLTRTLRKMIIISVALGVFASVTGLIASFHLNAPSGPTIVIILGFMFFLSLLVRRLGVRRS